MSRPLDEEKLEKIIRAAIRVFGDQGFSATTISTIAAQAQVATGTVYTYFSDKEELFVRAVNAVWDDFYRNMDVIFAESSTIFDKLDRLVEFAMPLLKDLHPIVRGMFSQANRLDLVHHHIGNLSNRFYLLFRESGFLDQAESAPGMKPEDIFRVWLSGFLFILSSVDNSNIDKEIATMTAFVRFMLGNLRTQGAQLP